MLTLLAWKNIWRNKKRSLIIIVAITLGLWGALLASALMMGWGESMVNTAIDRDLAHIQLHRPGYTRDHDIKHFIPDGMTVLAQIRGMSAVQAVSGRTLVDGMAASATSTFGVRIAGIDPGNAKKVTDIHKLLVGGTYFAGKGKNPILIGRKLAERLGLKLHSKVILGFQAMDDSLVYGAFRVAGIFQSESALFDKTHVFVRQADLLPLLNSSPVIHEIAVRAVSSREMAAITAALKTAYPGLSIKSWKALSPEIAVTAAAMESWSYIFVGIILMALIFGITNTMLMAVMERVQELGILLAVGMKKGKVFLMILLETTMLSLTGGICGMLLGWSTIFVLFRTGIDFSAFAASLASFGSATRIFPFLPAAMYFALVAMIIVAATLAATIPAWKAIHLQPSEAIRS
jgi:putative ABC transport system permease protein